MIWVLLISQNAFSVRISETVYLGRRPEKVSQRLRAAALCSQLPQGLMPIADVARLITSPRPMSSSLMKPGRRARYGWGSIFFVLPSLAPSVSITFISFHSFSFEADNQPRQP